GELLEAIGPDTTQADLLAIAKNSYGMNWTTPDQVRRRTGWLRCFGMVELWGTRVVRTAAGDAFLGTLTLCNPEKAIGFQEIQMSEEPNDEDVRLLGNSSEIDQESLRNRRALIGYIPRGVKSTNRDSDDSALTPTAAVRKIVELLGEGL